MYSVITDPKKLSYLVVSAVVVCATYAAFFRPALFANEQNLLAATGLVALGFLAYHYETAMPYALAMVFIWAGAYLPLQGTMQALRWVALAAAAFLGLFVYLRKHSHLEFNRVHLAAMCVVLAAFASAPGSVNLKFTALKASALGALFLYGSVGARTCWQDCPERLINGLLGFSEVLVWVSAAAYMVLAYPFWGNPNSLGLVMGIIGWPLMLWRYLAQRSVSGRTRRGLVLLLSGILLWMSSARAGMLAAAVASIVLLISARRYKPLVAGLAVVAFALLTLHFFWPNQLQEGSDSLLYKKGERTRGLMQSREGPWQQSMSAIKEHPWFGMGFGASEESKTWEGGLSTGATTRERGNSYLTAIEGFGLIGIMPLSVLLLMLLYRAGQVFLWVRVTGDLRHPSVPIAIVLVSGLLHAGFEDWLLAVGYHMTVIFWVLALSLPDLAVWRGASAARTPPVFATQARMPLGSTMR